MGTRILDETDVDKVYEESKSYFDITKTLSKSIFKIHLPSQRSEQNVKMSNFRVYNFYDAVNL